jgi:methyltransferase (TIGR00027 family)
MEYGPSATAQQVAMFRALAALDSREEIRGRDTLAAIFLSEAQKVLIHHSFTRTWAVNSPTSSGVYAYLLCRTAYLDEIVERSLRAGVPQLVLVGAGYDTRAYRFAALAGRTRIFELDISATQSRKLEILRSDGVAVPDGLTFVPADLRERSLSEALASAGFESHCQTLFILEGLVNYLTPQVVDRTLACIREGAGRESQVCLDLKYCASPAVSARVLDRMTASVRAFIENEPILFSIEPERLAPFLAERGFRVEEDLAAGDMERRFLTLRDGSLAGKVPTVFRIVRASIAE